MARPLFLFASLAAALIADAKNCVKINSCKCEMEDGSGIINLRSLAHPGNLPKWTLSGGDGWMYKYNPCLGYAMGSYADLAVGQASTSGSVYDLGVQSSASFNVTDDGQITISYLAKNTLRSSRVILKCDKTTRFDRLDFIGEMRITEYDMLLSSPCACPGYCDDFGLYDEIAKNMSGYWEHQRGGSRPVSAEKASSGAAVALYPWSDVGTSMVALLFHDVVLILGIASCIVVARYAKANCRTHGGRSCRYEVGRSQYSPQDGEDSLESYMEDGDVQIGRGKESFKIMTEVEGNHHVCKCNGASHQQLIGKPE